MIRIFALIVLFMGFAFPVMAQADKVDPKLVEEIVRNVIKSQTKPDTPEINVPSKAGSIAKETGNIAKDLSEGTRKELAQWSAMGTGVGMALIATAKELGMAANEFSQTGLGKVVIALIVYKMIGPSIIGIFVGSFILVVGYFIAYRIYRPIESKEYQFIPIFWGLATWKRANKVTIPKMSADEATIRVVVACLFLLVITGIAARMIF